MIQRDEETAQAKLFYAKLPDDISSRYCLLLDPMLGESLPSLTASLGFITTYTLHLTPAVPLRAERLTRRPSTFTATGGSAIKAVEVLIDHGVPQERIIFLNLVSCPEGLKAMHTAYPHVKVVTAWVDDGLDAHKYIAPGLGGEFLGLLAVGPIVSGR